MVKLNAFDDKELNARVVCVMT